MKHFDRVKTTTTTAGTGAVTCAATATSAELRTLPAAGAVVGDVFGYSIGVSGSAEWENGIGSITAISSGVATFSRTPTASSNGNALVNFSTGTKEVVCTPVADILNRLAGVRDAAFSTAVPLDFVGATYMPRTKVTSGMAFTAAAGAVRGALVYMRMLGNGADTPTFSGMLQWGSSLDFDTRDSIENQVQVFSDGTSVFYSITQAIGAVAVPLPATALTLTGPTGGVVSTASSTFNVGANGTLSSAVNWTASDGGAGGVFSATAGATPGSFTYTPSSTGAKTISITNNGGLTNPAPITYTATSAPTVPAAPTIGTATAGNSSASVAFTAPTNNGGAAIIDYTVTASPGGATATGTSSPISVPGLANGTAYTFTVKARNSVGPSAASAASNSVTPTVPATAYARFSQFSYLAETGSADPYTYNGSRADGWGNGGLAAGGMATTKRQPGVDGSIAVKKVGTGVMFSMTSSAGLTGYSSHAIMFYDYDTYSPFISGSRQSPTTNITPGPGDFYRFRWTGTTVYAEISKDNGASYTVFYTWTNVPTNVVNIQVSVLDQQSAVAGLAIGMA